MALDSLLLEDGSLLELEGGTDHLLLQSSTTAFVPSNIAGLQLWLKASTIIGLNDADPVTTWPDLSGNANDATQATAANKPTYQTNELNGKPVVRFDGVNDSLVCGSAIGGGNLTIFIVGKINADTTAIISQNSGAGGFLIQRDAVWADTLRPSWASSIFVGVYDLGCYVFNYTTDVYDIYDQGTLESSNSQPLATAFSGAPAIGSWDGARFLAGDVVEVIIYDSALSAADRNALGGYFETEYGIVVEGATFGAAAVGGAAARRRRR